MSAEPDEALSMLLELPEGRPVLPAAALARGVLSHPGLSHAVGAEGSAPALVARAIATSSGRPVLYVTPDLESARRAADDLAFLSKESDGATDATILLFTPSETSPYAEVHPERRAAMVRLATLFHVAKRLPFRYLVAPASALVRRVVPANAILAGAERIVAEDAIDLDRVVRRLTEAGYVRAPVVEDPGSFAVRGGIFDVWPPQLDAPIRAELDGDLVMSLKAFDPDSQRTTATLTDVWLPPSREAILPSEAGERARTAIRELADSVNWPSVKARRLADDVADGKQFYGGEGYLPAYYPLETLAGYLPDDTVVVVEEPPRVVRTIYEELEHAHAEVARRASSPHFPVAELYQLADELAVELSRHTTLALHRFGVAGEGAEGLHVLEAAPPDAPTLAAHDQAELERAVAQAQATRGKQGILDPLVDRLRVWEAHGLKVTIAARTGTQAERLAALLSHREVTTRIGDTDGDARAVRILVGPLSRGVVAPAEGFVLVTEEEIFGHRAHRAPEKQKKIRKALLEDLRALVPGDNLVHVDHGIGRYLGLERKSLGGASVEMLVVEYAGGDKLFLPVHRLNQVEKYSGAEGAPKLDRLGGQSFAKTKARVERKVREMADELLRLYAERHGTKRDPLPPPDDEYAALEATFPYEETRDQATAIADVLKDLEAERIMDRLVCGDVGFGKTEVAVRAAFRAANAGRQVALLCPTTVLAQQHFLTFSKRLKDFPLSIRVLSRFESKAEQEETVRGLKAGNIDIVIGTHRVLSKDVHFKSLGLVIVDEEHRFGVTHKERLKQLKTNVDVLTLTATPIPRTLQLAVGGLRDMSVITTPPADRRAIRTITTQFDDGLLREAIERELARGGQIFYVYNRVEGLYERAAHLREIVPQARIGVGHGQLDEATLEQTMLDFVEGKFDILASTAIIESGLDIPRANTMIIDRADLFGLAQLYQLRGRVGRSSERAYCYLIVPPPSQLTDEARYRIEAMERYTELGSGFQVATLDMELRGAGNVLGGEQTGFVSSVGFDLFCHMLEEAAHELRGEPVVHEVDPELTVDVDALLPESYVAEVGVRLSLYKRLSSASDEAEVRDIATEMEDRFGEAPLEARRLVELMRLKVELRKLRALGCEASARSTTLHLRDDTPLDPDKVTRLVSAKKSLYKVTPDMRLTRRAGEGEAMRDGIQLADRMLDELSGCMKDA
ncbi:MAG TPA: transcription-repair coupling factor [Polyangiaceae bacterium]|jgi:transcription-repair coupling factor (superfamily II helicase)|nr:transcription-repair coupling factor [Polyangiaceae bacterium]